MDKACIRNRVVARQDTQYLASTVEHKTTFVWIVSDRDGNNDGMPIEYASPDCLLTVVAAHKNKWAVCNERGQYLRCSPRADYKRPSPRYFGSPQAAAHCAEVVAEF